MTGKARHYDITVAGGGMVGATAASLLAKCGFSVALVETRQPSIFDPGAPVGLRVSALSQGSVTILEQAGAWPAIASERHCPYRLMHVEDGMSSACLDFAAPVFGMERLGTIVENDLVCSALWQVLQSAPGIDLHCPAQITSIEQGVEGVSVILDNGTVIGSDLLVAADGASSAARKFAGIGQDSWHYNQKGLVSVVEKSQPNPGVAWQRFLPQGPLAFLPLDDGRSSIVWTLPSDEADRKLKLSPGEFCAELEAGSAGWLGQVLACGPLAAFPLTMSLSAHYVANRLVLLGDSAHVVHPLAGQGVNLGLADAAALVEVLVEDRQAGAGQASRASLARYARWRKSESEMMANGIHALRTLFMPQSLSGIRQVGLKLVERSWYLKEMFLLRAAGQGRNAPKLARGVGIRALMQKTASRMSV